MNERIDTSQWQRLGVLFEQAIELDETGQGALLQAVGREDAELAKMLESLLSADAHHNARTSQQRERVLQRAVAAIDAPGSAVGDFVGPYVLREELGHGGMGVVFRAERVDGQVRQEVALKIVRHNLLDDRGRERFLREREIVTSFQHPGIARMLDVGQTEDGSPYLAMELIRGATITADSDARRLGTRDRVALFLRVCEAVQHAHANLVLHRDLKPSNVLVGDDGHPRLIDFGIAKPLAVATDEEQQHTATENRFFSPGNAAPEQLRGDRIGVACDVYQLGTLLHELLCGAAVFESAGVTPGQLEHRILEVVPEAPSARAMAADDEIAHARGVASPAALARELRGDLDAIVSLALRKVPAERYGSVEQLADDLRRYLESRPVAARRGQRWYRARKFVRRNALTIGFSTAAVVLVAVFVIALSMQSQRIVHERNLAQQRASEVEQVARFEGDMLKQVDPDAAGKQLMDDLLAKFDAALTKAGVSGNERSKEASALAAQLQHINATDAARDLIDRTILKPATAAIDKQFRTQPLVAATLRQVLADRYFDMGLYDAALPLQQSALAIRRRALGEDDTDSLQSINGMAVLLLSQGNSNQAEPYVRAGLARRRRMPREEDGETVQSIENMGWYLQSRGKLSEAEPFLREALAMSRRINGEEDKRTLQFIVGVGDVVEAQGHLSESEPYFIEAVQKMRRVLGDDDPITVAALQSLGWNLVMERKLSEADPDVREALQRSRRILGEDHPTTMNAISSMAMLLNFQGNYDQADPYLRELLAKRRRVQGELSTETLQALDLLGANQQHQGDLAGAETTTREWMDKARRVYGEDDSNTIYAINTVGRVLLREGKRNDAERYLREAFEKSRRLPPKSDDRHGLMKLTAVDLGELLFDQANYAEVESQLEPFQAEARSTQASWDDSVDADLLKELGRARARLGKFARAESDLLDAWSREVKLKHAKATRDCTQAIVELYDAWNKAEPGKGHDVSAAQWRQKQRAIGAPDPAR